MSIFDVQEPTNQDRLAMIEMGARMVNDHPLTGVGPNMIRASTRSTVPTTRSIRSIRTCTTCRLQIAGGARPARRSPCGCGSSSRLSSRNSGCFDGNATKCRRRGARGGLRDARRRLFEYNFGDSEFLMLFLVLVTLPFAAARGDDDSAAARA
jgi:hypothetical protein